MPKRDPLHRDPREAADDSYRSWELGIRLLRERHIRNHAIEPKDAEEQKWWDEGPKVKANDRT